jgi:hypothetical protein
MIRQQKEVIVTTERSGSPQTMSEREGNNNNNNNNNNNRMKSHHTHWGFRITRFPLLYHVGIMFWILPLVWFSLVEGCELYGTIYV